MYEAVIYRSITAWWRWTLYYISDPQRPGDTQERIDSGSALTRLGARWALWRSRCDHKKFQKYENKPAWRRTYE